MFLYSVFLKIYIFLQLSNIPNLALGVFCCKCLSVSLISCVTISVRKRFAFNFSRLLHLVSTKSLSKTFLISRVSLEKSSLMYIPVLLGGYIYLNFSVYLYSWLIFLQLQVSLTLLGPLHIF